MNIALITIWLSLKKNKISFLCLLLIFSSLNIHAEVLKNLQYTLKFDNHYLNIKYNNELLSFIMIYFYQLQSTKNKDLIDCLVVLLSHAKKITPFEARNKINIQLIKSKNPIEFYRYICK